MGQINLSMFSSDEVKLEILKHGGLSVIIHQAIGEHDNTQIAVMSAKTLAMLGFIGEGLVFWQMRSLPRLPYIKNGGGQLTSVSLALGLPDPRNSYAFIWRLAYSWHQVCWSGQLHFLHSPSTPPTTVLHFPSHTLIIIHVEWQM